jgi:hypothetical protein
MLHLLTSVIAGRHQETQFYQAQTIQDEEIHTNRHVLMIFGKLLDSEMEASTHHKYQHTEILFLPR